MKKYLGLIGLMYLTACDVAPEAPLVSTHTDPVTLNGSKKNDCGAAATIYLPDEHYPINGFRGNSYSVYRNRYERGNISYGWYPLHLVSVTSRDGDIFTFHQFEEQNVEKTEICQKFFSSFDQYGNKSGLVRHEVSVRFIFDPSEYGNWMPIRVAESSRVQKPQALIELRYLSAPEGPGEFEKAYKKQAIPITMTCKMDFKVMAYWKKDPEYSFIDEEEKRYCNTDGSCLRYKPLWSADECEFESGVMELKTDTNEKMKFKMGGQFKKAPDLQPGYQMIINEVQFL